MKLFAISFFTILEFSLKLTLSQLLPPPHPSYVRVIINWVSSRRWVSSLLVFINFNIAHSFRFSLNCKCEAKLNEKLYHAKFSLLQLRNFNLFSSLSSSSSGVIAKMNGMLSMFLVHKESFSKKIPLQRKSSSKLPSIFIKQNGIHCMPRRLKRNGQPRFSMNFPLQLSTTTWKSEDVFI